MNLVFFIFLFFSGFSANETTIDFEMPIEAVVVPAEDYDYATITLTKVYDVLPVVVTNLEGELLSENEFTNVQEFAIDLIQEEDGFIIYLFENGLPTAFMIEKE